MSKTKTPTILFVKTGVIAHIILNRPEVINAYNMQMRDELYQTLEAVRDDLDIRVCVIRGNGPRGFCAGADLTEFGTAPSQVIARSIRWERDIWGLWLSITKPMVAMLHGYVIGSGVEMACACDIRIASSNAIFRMPEVALGMLPAAGGTQTLQRIIGLGPALDTLLTNKPLSSDEALKLGLVHKVVTNEALMTETELTSQTLASYDATTLALVKTAITSGLDIPLNAGLDMESRLSAIGWIGKKVDHSGLDSNIETFQNNSKE